MTETMSISVVALTTFILIACYSFIIYPIFFSPLSQIPSAHPVAKISSFWILWIRWKEADCKVVHAAHQKYGPIIRLSPTELSINCVDGGIKTIYSKGFEKHSSYSVFTNYGVPNMFSTILNKPHSILRRKVAPIYSKVSLFSSTYLVRVYTEMIHARLIPILRSVASSGSLVNVVDSALGLPMDIMSAYLVGIPSSTDFTTDTAALKVWMETYETSVKALFWKQEFPNLTWFLSLTGLNPITSKSNLATAKIEKWFLTMISSLETRIEKDLAEPSEGSIYRSLLSQKDPSNPQARLEVASELLDHLLAAQHTTARTITYLISELSVNPGIQASLRAELLTLPSSATAYALDKLPLLHACILETLRLHPSSTGAEPRVTPHCGTVLAGFYIPGGIRVSAQSYSLHRAEAVFPDAERWAPERWMRCQVEQREMEEGFWAFGSGARRCVGRSFAMMALKALLHGIYGRDGGFVTSIGGEVVRQRNGGDPEGEVWVRFERGEE